jgi:hypothetical protein
LAQVDGSNQVLLLEIMHPAAHHGLDGYLRIRYLVLSLLDLLFNLLPFCFFELQGQSFESYRGPFSFELNQLTKTNYPNTLFITFLSKRKIIISY